MNVGPGEARKALQGVVWPTLLARILTTATTPKVVRDLLKVAVRTGGTATASDVLRALEILLAAKLLKLG